MSHAWCDCRGDLAAGSWAEVKQGILRAKELCSAGGDWERKNRLKVHLSAALHLSPASLFC